MVTIYYDKDADPKMIQQRTIAIIGYGIMGRAQGLNLRDSGCKVLVAELPGTPNWDQAERDGQTLTSAEKAAETANVVQILTQDHIQAKVYREQIKPHLKAGNALFFSHGFNIHYNQIVPEPNVDVVMIAPKGPGSLVRSQYLAGGGVPCLLAVHQDHTGQAKALGLSHAWAIGGTKGGVIETTFREETESDLFGEQSVLCGGVSELIRAGFDTLVEAGFQPEMAFFECCHEVKLIMDLVFKHGISGMRRRVSDTAEYGDMTRGRRIIDEHVRENMRAVLREIQSGEFAREWLLENQAGRPMFTRLLEQDDNHLIEKVGRELRASMPWLEDL